jgi:hypothetical protein
VRETSFASKSAPWIAFTALSRQADSALRIPGDASGLLIAASILAAFVLPFRPWIGRGALAFNVRTRRARASHWNKVAAYELILR